jgi:Outer membrane protein Omp28/Secretion system C-terminal sorting domain
MKALFFFFYVLLLITPLSFGQFQKKVLVEDFTNSHCPLCPPAYTALYSFEDSDTSAKHVSFIFYHMPFPYSDDPLYQANKSDPAARNSYYGPYSSTPKGFFDGKIQSNVYGFWGTTLEGLVKNRSPLKIDLSGSKGSNGINLKTEITRNGDISQTDLVIHFIVVENIHYQGRNGVSRHDNVMRKMLPSPAGRSISVNDGETIEIDTTISLDSSWNPDSLKVVVFIQSTSSKEVYQSETIAYSYLNLMTDVKINTSDPSKFSLEQNYPNPFNPSTKINYYLPERSRVILNIYNILGKKVSYLVNNIEPVGNHILTWNAENFSSGFYFLTIEAAALHSENRFTKTIKMILLK